MVDKFKDHNSGLSSPASSAFDITPDDGTALQNVPRAFYVGGSGAIRLIMQDGQTVTFTQVQSGVIYPLRCTHVLATGTTATDIVGLY